MRGKVRLIGWVDSVLRVRLKMKAVRDGVTMSEEIERMVRWWVGRNPEVSVGSSINRADGREGEQKQS